MSDKTSESLA